MFTSKKYQNKKIAIYGMGKTGCSAAKTFEKLGSKVFCWDDNKKVRKKIKDLDFSINKFWLSEKTVDAIVISPGIDSKKCELKNYLKKNLNKVITDLDLFFELNKNSLIISITGTNGKSTTCKIIEKILTAAKYNVKTVGNIGNPILSLQRKNKNYIFILEVSSYQLEYSKIFHSKHAAILNISPDHLERHGNLKNYIKIKSKIFFAQNRSDYSYINLENKNSTQIKKIFKSKKLNSKLIEVKKSNCNSILKKVNNKYFDIECNIENLTFAYKIAKNLKISDKVIINAINKFKGLPHRQEVIFSNKKMLCVNDSKATSFEASLQSLASYNKIYWIVGGLPKRQDYFNLKKVKKNIIKAYIIGKHTSFFERQIKGKIPYIISKNLNSAVNKIYSDIMYSKISRCTVLLSPAAASFDQFNNFETRGDHFKSLIIKKLN